MSQSIIRCPNCKTEIDISKSLYEELEQKAKKSLKKEIDEHRERYKKALSDLNKKELELKSKESELESQVKLKTKELLEEELLKERDRLKAELKRKIELEKSIQLESLQKELEQKSKEVVELNAKKAEIEKLKREKEELASSIKLQMQRELNSQLKEERNKITKAIQEEHLLKLKEKDEQLDQIKRQLEETKRKAEQGSQQIQGEAQELAIEEWLKSHFIYDEIKEVKKGAYGADCIQTIHTRELPNCGKICYESKNAKTFNNEWIAKLKQDMLKANAELGVLVTTIYPKGLDRMGLVDGIWVCSLEEFKGSVALLRESLIRVKKSLIKEENKGDKMALLYNYLTGSEFSMSLQAIVDGFIKMREELEKEKRSVMASWKRREKLIEGVLENTTQMYGSLQGIAGNSIAHIKELELEYNEGDDE